MSVSCGLECVLCVGCVRWAWKRLTYIGAYDSEHWPPASAYEFEPVPRICHVIMAINEEDLSRPKFAPSGHGYADLDPAGVVKHVTYNDVGTDCPPYIVYLDRQRNEVILTVRGLNLVRTDDYKDDFLPRTPTPLEYIFGSIFCLPCLIFLVCLRDTFKQDKKKFKDPRRL